MSIELTEAQQQYLTTLLQQRKVLYKDEEKELKMISSILDQIGGELIVVPFGDDGVNGDTIWIPECNVPHIPNMTRSQLKLAFAKKEWKDCGYDDRLTTERSVDKLMGEEGYTGFAGGWVIKKSVYDKIMRDTSDLPFNNDTECYATNRTIKTMIKTNAVDII